MTTGNPWAAILAGHGDAVAVRDDAGTALTYADVLALRAQFDTTLGRRSLVFLRTANSAASVAAWLALLASDHATLAIEHDLAPERLAALVDLYRPDAIIDPQGAITPGPGGTALHPDLSVLLSTSGSTGSPKLARFTAAALFANAAAIADYLGLTAAERPFLALPTSYSYGMSVINSHALVGACVEVTAHGVMQAEFWDGLKNRAATSLSGVPFHYDAIRRLGLDRLATPTLTTLTQAGGKLPAPVAAKYAEWGAANGRRFITMYGQTEAGPRLTWLPPELLASHAGAIGVPIPGVTIELVDSDGAAITEPGVSGEMRCSSPAIMMGYAQGAADLARGDELGGVLMTGDLASRNEAGVLSITGRASRMIKLFGTRVNLDDIDAQLARMDVPGVSFGQDDQLRVLVEAGDPETVRAALIAAFSFPPRGLMVKAVASLPRASSGKLLYGALGQAWEAAT
jgi:acyl-CoA synthetase (AMP-forming)/AMP-acid ligase II